ncbi:MAG: UDP-N-acetylmuramoyl-L-alanyl-D-glutamate--2,6-diaminopimelate ligase [Lentisphaerae bacterium GWF2_49_21]|nr:MAG: UDP-N-acetylmuramoyl-L-alanyl-D-glutamate--2,6-diaminopimelate ligase [Lentisphaerae bacterium GWF2_49_21]
MVSSVTNDSRSVAPSSVFIAIQGSGKDGHDFIDSAIASGAKAVIHARDISSFKNGISYIKVSDSYSAYARLVECFYDFPSSKMKILGVTGTNGKTSSVYLLNSILTSAGLKCGIITTVCYEWPGHSEPAARTTPEASEIQSHFSKMYEAGCTHVIMEVSSHALHQNRIGSAKFAGAIFTNLTGDHLDYHKTMEFYYDAKKILFQDHLAVDAVAAINTDDPFGKRLFADLRSANCIRFGRENCDAVIKINSISQLGTDFTLSIEGRTFKISSPLIGEHNAYNICGVAIIAYKLGISPEIIQSTLEKSIAIPGRLEAFHFKDNVSIFVDYAHSDDALRRVLEALTKLKKKRIICVFGCGGDRDRTKRPRMGAVSAKFADRTIVTSDNPRSEDPKEIIAEIVKGIPSTANFATVPDRGEAIEKALNEAEPGDIVLIAGKGHEDYQEIKGVKHHFDDREEVRKLIGSI